MESHENRHMTLLRLPLLCTLFVMTIAFIGGFSCGLAFKTSRGNRTLSSSALSKVLASAVTNFSTPSSPTSRDSSSTSPSPAPASEPAGLSMYKKAYENPWSFSTLRTGIDELMRSCDHFMEHEGSLPRLVVSFTSLPRRFQIHGYSMLTLLKQQTLLPDAIYIAIPRQSRRSNESFTIPKWIKEDPLITVLRPLHDYGPATKLIPAVEEELRLGYTDTRIITVDDDNEGGWRSDSLLNLYAYSLHFKDAAVGFTGWNITCMVSDAHCSPVDSGVPQRQFRDKMYNFIRQSDDYACHSLFDWKLDYYSYCMGAVRKNYVGFADVLEGYKGVVYQPRFFNLSKLKSVLHQETPEWFFLADDVWFSAWLGVEGVKRLVVNPAIHKDAPIAVALREYSNRKNLSREMPVISQYVNKGNAEKGLHSMTQDFVRANHRGVRWFEKLGAWDDNLWTKPDGFEYASEVNSSDAFHEEVAPTFEDDPNGAAFGTHTTLPRVHAHKL